MGSQLSSGTHTKPQQVKEKLPEKWWEVEFMKATQTAPQVMVITVMKDNCSLQPLHLCQREIDIGRMEM